MCLNIKGSREPLIAKKDILVYKRLERNYGVYETPYQDTIVNIGSRGTRMKAELDIRGYSVYAGIHAYIDKKSVIRMAEKILDSNTVIIEAIIPKGAKYLIGTNNDIVATEMKLGKIIYRVKD